MTLEITRRRRHAVETIHDIVSALRHRRRAHSDRPARLACARRYQEVVLRALEAVAAGSGPLRLPDDASGPLLLVLIAEQPLCGPFNQDVLALAERRWRELRGAGEASLAVVGQRGRRHLAARGIVPDAFESAATSPAGLRDMVKRLAELVDRRYAAGRLGALHVIYSRYQSVSEQTPAEERILPLELPARAPAKDFYRYLDTPHLLAGLVSEYAYISLYQAAADSFASEQASRLVAMDAATRDTERLAKSLTDLERRERQDEITRDVLELIAARFAAD